MSVAIKKAILGEGINIRAEGVAKGGERRTTGLRSHGLRGARAGRLNFQDQVSHEGAKTRRKSFEERGEGGPQMT